jgi:hypothetical protein
MSNETLEQDMKNINFILNIDSTSTKEDINDMLYAFFIDAITSHMLILNSFESTSTIKWDDVLRFRVRKYSHTAWIKSIIFLTINNFLVADKNDNFVKLNPNLPQSLLKDILDEYNNCLVTLKE